MHRLLPLAALSLFLLTSFAHAADVPQPAGIDASPAAGQGAPTATARHTDNHDTMGANAQTCTDSCNRGYEVCTDQGDALPGNQDALRNSNNLASQLIGNSSDCSDHLRSCLNTCGG